MWDTESESSLISYRWCWRRGGERRRWAPPPAWGSCCRPRPAPQCRGPGSAARGSAPLLPGDIVNIELYIWFKYVQAIHVFLNPIVTFSMDHHSSWLRSGKYFMIVWLKSYVRSKASDRIPKTFWFVLISKCKWCRECTQMPPWKEVSPYSHNCWFYYQCNVLVLVSCKCWVEAVRCCQLVHSSQLI